MSLSYLLFVFPMWALLQTVPADEVEITVRPAKVDMGISAFLDVNCSVTLDGSSLTNVSSIVLYRETDSEGSSKMVALATLTAVSSPAVGLVVDEEIYGDGVVSYTGKSYLHLRWDYPTMQQNGHYRCVAQGPDASGADTSAEGNAMVTVNIPDIMNVLAAMRQLQIHFKEVDNQNIVLEQKLTTLEQNSNTNVQPVDTSDLSNGIAELRVDNNILSETVKVLVTHTFTVDHSSLFSYGNSKYFISEAPFTDYSTTLGICKVMGGYLAEINDTDEYNALTAYLNTRKDFSFLVIGGTDEASDTNWVLPSTNQPLPFTLWSQGEPFKSPTLNCLALYSLTAWKMVTNNCHIDKPNPLYRFMCEIPGY